MSSLPLRPLALGLLALSALLTAPGLTRAAETATATTAITNVYAGQSVVRFANPRSDRAAVVKVGVYGVTDKRMLGAFQVEVPALASIQVRAEERLQTFAPVNWDQLVVLYVESDQAGQLWQHLRRSPATGHLANASVCTYPQGASPPPGNHVINATLTHAYMGAAEPHASFISLHNPSDESATYEARLTDAATGEVKGRVDVSLEPHGSFSQSSYWYQSSGGWHFPLPTQMHMNITFLRKAETAAINDLIVGHTLVDVIDGVSVNVSNPCPIHHAAAAGAR